MFVPEQLAATESSRRDLEKCICPFCAQPVSPLRAVKWPSWKSKCKSCWQRTGAHELPPPSSVTEGGRYGDYELARRKASDTNAMLRRRTDRMEVCVGVVDCCCSD